MVRAGKVTSAPNTSIWACYKSRKAGMGNERKQNKTEDRIKWRPAFDYGLVTRLAQSVVLVTGASSLNHL